MESRMPSPMPPIRMRLCFRRRWSRRRLRRESTMEEGSGTEGIIRAFGLYELTSRMGVAHNCPARWLLPQPDTLALPIIDYPFYLPLLVWAWALAAALCIYTIPASG